MEEPTRVRSQHMSILPISAQIVTKSGTLVGVVGAVRCVSKRIQELPRANEGLNNVRAEQSRSAIPRTLTSQHCAVPEVQTGT